MTLSDGTILLVNELPHPLLIEQIYIFTNLERRSHSFIEQLHTEAAVTNEMSCHMSRRIDRLNLNG
jgi:hypothetical protein